MERELYVYFLKDEDYLKDIVENLENQSKIKAVGLEDWKLLKSESLLNMLCFNVLYIRKIDLINPTNILNLRPVEYFI